MPSCSLVLHPCSFCSSACSQPVSLLSSVILDFRQYGSSCLRKVANVSSSNLWSRRHRLYYHSHYRYSRNDNQQTPPPPPQPTPLYLHTASKCNHHYWSGSCGTLCSTDIWTMEAARRWKDAGFAEFRVLTSTWAFATANQNGITGAVVPGEMPVVSSYWEKESRAEKRAEDAITTPSVFPGCLLYWETLLWVENALAVMRLYPDEVPLRKTSNPPPAPGSGGASLILWAGSSTQLLECGERTGSFSCAVVCK